MTTFDLLVSIVARDFEVSPDRLTPETPLESIGLDSLAATEVFFSLEEQLGVESNHVVDIRTLGDVAAHFDELVAQKARA